MNFDKRKVKIAVAGLGTVQSFKNRKRAIPAGRSKNGKQAFRTLTDPKVKERMDRMEDATVSALCSLCRTESGVMDSECLKQLRTFLSGLSDDSLNQIPEFSFGTRYVPKGEEGFEIEIEEIT